jgi:hypothetical protein
MEETAQLQSSPQSSPQRSPRSIKKQVGSELSAGRREGEIITPAVEDDEDEMLVSDTAEPTMPGAAWQQTAEAPLDRAKKPRRNSQPKQSTPLDGSPSATRLSEELQAMRTSHKDSSVDRKRRIRRASAMLDGMEDELAELALEINNSTPRSLPDTAQLHSKLDEPPAPPEQNAMISEPEPEPEQLQTEGAEDMEGTARAQQNEEVEAEATQVQTAADDVATGVMEPTFNSTEETDPFAQLEVYFTISSLMVGGVW